ncbi:MAG: hypothetical protein ACD_7C00487G0004 [uncultured bacterium]|nr:MAG: hypothetical protein ACD_7C00487G0004 [uncultured bacterium]
MSNNEHEVGLSDGEKNDTKESGMGIFHEGCLEEYSEAPVELRLIMDILRRAGSVTAVGNGIYKIKEGTYLIFER